MLAKSFQPEIRIGKVLTDQEKTLRNHFFRLMLIVLLRSDGGQNLHDQTAFPANAAGGIIAHDPIQFIKQRLRILTSGHQARITESQEKSLRQRSVETDPADTAGSGKTAENTLLVEERIKDRIRTGNNRMFV